MKTTNININILVDKDLKHIGFKNELSQVIMVIIDNAIDELKKLDSNEKVLTIDAKVSNNETFKITFEDNAKGIPEDILDKIFDPYFSTKSLNGTGVGLYMSKVIIENSMGGEIIAYNTKNGACFEITLPKEVKSHHKFDEE